MNLKQSILKAGTELAERQGLAATTRDDIAARVSCSGGSVSFHYGDARHIRRAIVEAAIENKNLRVLGWAVAERHPSVAKLAADLQRDALRVHLAR